MIFDARHPVLITGGAGFIGSNLAHRLLSDGQPVLVFDNLSRVGAEENLAWLRERHGALLEAHIADVRDMLALRRALRTACRVFHLAAQVSAEVGLTDPLQDFDVTARGTLNLLEAARGLPETPPLLHVSTNKVYGRLAGVELSEVGGRYVPLDAQVREAGIDESQPLDLHTPFGCSQGTAEQYVLEYARAYRLPAVVLRAGCAYGLRQGGGEAQGWVGQVLHAILRDEPITVHGDGRQVLDPLAVDDLIDAMLKAQVRIQRLGGRVFNIGGGAQNAVSVLGLLDMFRRLHGRLPQVRFAPWRPLDQRYFVADFGAFAAAAGWRPKVSLEEGSKRLHAAWRDRVAGERRGPARSAAAPVSPVTAAR